MSAYFILDVLPVKQGERQFWTLTLLKMKRRYITPNVTICNIGFSKVLASSAPFDIPFNGRNRCWISVLFNTLAQKEYERLPAELENKDCLFYPRNTQTEKIVSLLSLKSSLENEDYMDAVPKMNKAYFERQRICIPSQAEALWNRLFADTENIGSDVLYIFYYKDYFVCMTYTEAEVLYEVLDKIDFQTLSIQLITGAVLLKDVESKKKERTFTERPEEDTEDMRPMIRRPSSFDGLEEF